MLSQCASALVFGAIHPPLTAIAPEVGVLLHNLDKIIYRDEYRTEYIASVDPKTVCRNTGAYDKYGNWVFENDIVKIGKYEYVVVWDEERNGYALKCDGHKYQFFNIKERPEIEVIGNIFSGKTKALR